MLILKTLSSIQNKERGNSSEKNNLNAKSYKPSTNIPVNMNIQNNMKAQMLTRMEQALFMREMLNLPKDLKELLALLINKQISNENLTHLLQTKNIKIDPEIIKQLLETNSKEVINKLIKLIQQTQNAAQDYSQLKQVLGLINQIVPPKTAQSQDILTHLLLLYLPWLPLSEEQKIEVEFEKKKSGSPEEEQIAMVIYITTINIGRFKITTLTDKNNNLDIHIESITNKEENKNNQDIEKKEATIEKILKTINSQLKEEKITATTHLSKIEQKHFTQKTEQKVTITKVNSISPMVLVTAQKTAQIILEADEKITLLKKRRTHINE